jgi:hypothetical protein
MLDQLNPFAVTVRYEFLDLEPVNRNQLRSRVETIRHWAELQIN